jgi:hypothetical protein
MGDPSPCCAVYVDAAVHGGRHWGVCSKCGKTVFEEGFMVAQKEWDAMWAQLASCDKPHTDRGSCGCSERMGQLVSAAHAAGQRSAFEAAAKNIAAKARL